MCWNWGTKRFEVGIAKSIKVIRIWSRITVGVSGLVVEMGVIKLTNDFTGLYFVTSLLYKHICF